MTRLLRAEAAILALVLLLLLVRAQPPLWLWLAVLVAPDLSLLAYLRGPRVGALLYNIAHSAVGPGLVALLSLALAPGAVADRLIFAAALLWGLHIAVDRALGYGLKHRSDFKDTYLGRIGR